MATRSAVKLTKRFWDPHKIFDVSHKEQLAIAERAKMRAELKKDWQKKVSHPFRKDYVFDPQIQRFYSMRSTQFEHFKPTHKNFAAFLTFIVTPYVLFTWAYLKHTREQEALYRSGKIAYKDREYKLL